MNGYGWGGHMGGMWIWSVLLIVLIALAVWWAVNASQHSGSAKRDSAEEALRLRYARGEIDKDEFERRLLDLRR